MRMKRYAFLFFLAYASATIVGAHNIVSNFPWSTTCEDDPFTIVNGTQANQWRYGTVEDGLGISMYIGSDLTVGNNYWTTGASGSQHPAYSVVHAYIDLAVPEGYFNINLSFDVRVGGQQNKDGLQVLIVPHTYTPTAGSNIPGGPHFRRLDTLLHTIPQWQTRQYQLSPGCAGDTVRLVFSWRNDFSNGAQPGANVDNISITVDQCISPFFAQMNSITTSSALAVWPEVLAPGGYSYELRTQGNPGTGPVGLVASGTMDTNSLQLGGLAAGTFYELHLRSDCTPEWSAGVPFVTDPECGSTFYDPGGPSAPYSPNTDRTYVICPSGTGTATRVQFMTLHLALYDRIEIFDGPVASVQPKLVLDNNSVPFSITSNSYDGCLTLRFIADAFSEGQGWSAQVHCSSYPYPACAIWGEEVEEFGPDSVLLRWQCAYSYGSYIVERTLPGHDFGTGAQAGPGGDVQMVSSKEIVLQGLTPGAAYDLQVRTSCNSQYNFESLGARVRIQVPPKCGFPFTDRGGATELYPPYAWDSNTICPDVPGYPVSISFSSFAVEHWYDALYIFDGPDTAAPLIPSGLPEPLSSPNLGANGWWGTTIPSQPFVSTHPSGCLTTVFISDETGELDGWIADVQCDMNVGIADHGATSRGLQCYPIPVGTGEELQITGLPTNGGPLPVRIMDAVGRIVYQEDVMADLNGSASVRLPLLSGGVYFLGVEGERLLVARFIVR